MEQKRLKAVNSPADLPRSLRKTPLAELFNYHNFEKPFKKYDKARLMVCMCMDNRKQLRLPDNFAYILRTGGGNVRHSEFKVSYAVGVGGVRHIAMIAHDNCGMANLFSKRETFIKGLMKNAGWTRKRAMDYFVTYAPLFEIGNEIDFAIGEARRLNFKYPKVKVIPMFYAMKDARLYLIRK